MPRLSSIFLSLILIACHLNVHASLHVEDLNKLKYLDGPNVSVFAPQQGRHSRRNHATVVNELMARITSALSAVGGDDEAVPIGDATTPSTMRLSMTMTTTSGAPPDTSNASSSSAAFNGAPSSTLPPAERLPGACREADEEEEEKEEVEEEDECQGLFVTSGAADDQPPSKALANKRNMTDNERLVALQSCFQKKVKRRLMNTARSSMELFDKLSLSGGCTSSLMNLMSGLAEIKSYAFKFLDASAKIPSGVMYGLLSDFGDFDQCLSIRSNGQVSPQVEAEEGAYSGKYCLLSVRLNYHVQLGQNATVPEGIYEDGVLWDELVRNYWTSKTNKGFQIGVCVPSRCSNDDLEQIYRIVAESYNILGEVLSCQDSNDLRRQLTPDFLQLVILYIFASLLMLNIVGTFVERYWSSSKKRCHKEQPVAYQLLVCFSIRRNWASFMQTQNAPTTLAFSYDESPMSNEAANNGIHASGQVQQLAGRRIIDSIVSPNSRTATTIADTLASSSSFDNSISSSKPDESQADLVEHNEIIDYAKNGQSLEAKQESRPLSIQVSSDEDFGANKELPRALLEHSPRATDKLLSHLSGIKLIVIVWITIGHSFLYPSANNYQYYRSIINMNITRDSVWFAATNFTLGIDMLLYMTGLLFVYKLAHTRSVLMLSPSLASLAGKQSCSLHDRSTSGGCQRIAQEFTKKILRFWPTYLTVISIAIVIPLIGDGPMWPEMVAHRLGESCRKNWWANLLILNNLFDQTEICLPSSWFMSVLMQLFLIGSLIMLVVRNHPIILAISIIGTLLVGSSAISFAFAYCLDIKAPVIRMDESFVLELDNNIFRLYTNIFNNIGPFLVGMVGGFILVRWQAKQAHRARLLKWQPTTRLEPMSSRSKQRAPAGVEFFHRNLEFKVSGGNLVEFIQQLAIALVVSLIAVLVLLSVFQGAYTTFLSAIYWSCHRVGWAIVTGYIIHQCAIGRWKLLKDLLSLSHLIPFSRLIFIAYLVYPIFIHMHSGLVRDGLHVSIYNMMNIYITRLVFTFSLALIIHLLVELPFCSIETILLTRWMKRRHCPTPSSHPSLASTPQSSNESGDDDRRKNKLQPLLAVAPPMISIHNLCKKNENPPCA